MRLFVLLFLCGCDSAKPMEKGHPHGDLEFEIDDLSMLAMPADLLTQATSDLAGTDLASLDLASAGDMATVTTSGDLGGVTSCKELHTADPAAPSGLYNFPGYSAWCDMNTDGGGWTMVFSGTAAEYNSDTIDYDVAQSHWTSATEVLTAFRNPTNDILGDWARFPMPAKWKTKAPFQYDTTDDANVMVVVSGAAPVSTTLRYGRQDFTAFCGDGWNTVGTRWGRICMTNTNAPFWDGWATYLSDGCQKSTEDYGTTACTLSRGFTIGVR